MDVGEVAPAAAGDQDLAPRALAAFEQQHAMPAPPGLERAHHARRACAEDDDVVLVCPELLRHLRRL